MEASIGANSRLPTCSGFATCCHAGSATSVASPSARSPTCLLAGRPAVAAQPWQCRRQEAPRRRSALMGRPSPLQQCSQVKAGATMGEENACREAARLPPKGSLPAALTALQALQSLLLLLLLLRRWVWLRRSRSRYAAGQGEKEHETHWQRMVLQVQLLVCILLWQPSCPRTKLNTAQLGLRTCSPWQSMTAGWSRHGSCRASGAG